MTGARILRCLIPPLILYPLGELKRPGSERRLTLEEIHDGAASTAHEEAPAQIFEDSPRTGRAVVLD